MSQNVRRRPEGKFDVYHIDNDRFIGTYDDETEATRACMAGTSISSLFENMLAEDLFTDDLGNPIKTAHLSQRGPITQEELDSNARVDELLTRIGFVE